MNTLTRNVDESHNATLQGLIKANNWIFEQINKQIPVSLSPIKAMTTGTDGAQIFADQKFSANSIFGEEGEDSNLILTTSLNLDLDRINVSLFREDDFSDVEFQHMPHLTRKVEIAFIEAGLLRH